MIGPGSSRGAIILPKMSLGTTLKSSIGAKVLMAVTGILLALFVVGHMLGNLQVFLGPEKLNAYAATLQGLGPLLWVIRIGLLAILLGHVVAAMKVVRMSKEARPVAYAKRTDIATSFAARTMFVSGILLVLFVVYHVLHFTTGHLDLAGSYGQHTADGGHDVYLMVVQGFQHWPTTAIYIVAMLILCVHLSHGVSSLMQTLGLRRNANAGTIDKVGPVFAAIIFIGNVSMPLAAISGLIS